MTVKPGDRVSISFTKEDNLGITVETSPFTATVKQANDNFCIVVSDRGYLWYVPNDKLKRV